MRISAFQHLLLAALLASGLLVRAIGLEAQTIDSPYRFIEGRHDAGAVAGYLAENRGALGIGPGGGTYVGLRYGLEIRGPFALEASGFYVSSERDIYEPVVGEGLLQRGSTDMSLLGVDARIRFTLTGTRTWYGLAPYLSAGAGLVGALSGESEIDQELDAEDRFEFGTSFLGTLGAGTRWIPGERLTVRAEAGLNIWKVPMPAGFNEVREEEDGLAGDDWTGMGTLLLGLSYRF